MSKTIFITVLSPIVKDEYKELCFMKRDNYDYLLNKKEYEITYQIFEHNQFSPPFYPKKSRTKQNKKLLVDSLVLINEQKKLSKLLFVILGEKSDITTEKIEFEDLVNKFENNTIKENVLFIINKNHKDFQRK